MPELPSPGERHYEMEALNDRKGALIILFFICLNKSKTWKLEGNMFKMWRKKKEKGNGLPGVRWAHYIYMRRDSWTQDALKLPNTQTGSLRAEGGRKCDDQDKDEDGQAHGDPNLLLHGERERPGNISKVPVSFNVTLRLFSSFISDSYLARLLLIRHRLLGVFLGLHHVVRRLFDVGFDPVHHLPLREAVTPVGALRMTLEQGSPTPGGSTL